MRVEKDVYLMAEGGRLTAEIKRVLKRSTTHIGVLFGQIANPEKFNRDRCDVTLIFRNETAPDEFGVVRSTRYMVEGFSGRIGTGTREARDSYDQLRYSREEPNHYDPRGGYWVIGLGNDTLRSVVGLLPSGTRLTFEVGLDHGTTHSLVSAGWHGDVLTMTAESGKGKRLGEFVIDSDISGTSVRFGKDHPSQKAALKGAA